MKTLQEVEPRIPINATNTPGDGDSVFRITQPGSYYLTGNLTGESGKGGIEIASGNVSIDLMGFTLQGVPGSLNGIWNSVTAHNLMIHNGVIRAFGDTGVQFRLFTMRGLEGETSECVIERVRVSENVQDGISADASTVVRDCVVTNNGFSGIVTFGQSVIEGCIARGNGSEGVSANAGPTIIRGCTAVSNVGCGIFSFERARISDCLAEQNGSDGFNTQSDGVTITGCTASDNSGVGFYVLGAVVSNCIANNNSMHGISGGATIFNCSAIANTLDGIHSDGGANISHCTAQANSRDGITGGAGSVISDCLAQSNANDGIEVLESCLVLRNSCVFNGVGVGLDGAGIHATSFRNRIEGNKCQTSPRGIDVDISGNLIIANTCVANTTHYEIAANNRYGPIINITAGGTAAVSGNSAVSTVASTDPWANFAY